MSNAQLRIVTTEGRPYVTPVQSMTDALDLHDVLVEMMRRPSESVPITLRTFWGDAPFTLSPSAIATVEVIPVTPQQWKGELWTP